MQKESLEQAIDIIIDHIGKSNISPIDKAELILNLFHFLDNEMYEENLKILSRRRTNC